MYMWAIPLVLLGVPLGAIVLLICRFAGVKSRQGFDDVGFCLGVMFFSGIATAIVVIIIAILGGFHYA